MRMGHWHKCAIWHDYETPCPVFEPIDGPAAKPDAGEQTTETLLAQLAQTLAKVKACIMQTLSRASEGENAENLAGNVTKLNYWKGEKAAARRLRWVLEESESQHEKS